MTVAVRPRPVLHYPGSKWGIAPWLNEVVARQTTLQLEAL